MILLVRIHVWSEYSPGRSRSMGLPHDPKKMASSRLLAGSAAAAREFSQTVPGESFSKIIEDGVGVDCTELGPTAIGPGLCPSDGAFG